MKSLAQLNSIRCIFAIAFGTLLFVTAIPCLAQQDNAKDTAELPFDVFNQPIDNRRILFHLEENAGMQKKRQAPDAVATIQTQLKNAKTSSDLVLDSLVSQPVPEQENLYKHLVKSSLYLGQFYNCGRCDRSHTITSGGVVISESGLALTNYHVFTFDSGGTTEGFMAMTYDGKCFEVEKVLAADEVADVALVQLKADGHKFYAAPIAKSRPLPMNGVHIISSPKGEFYTLTSGQVSRYAKVRQRREEQARPDMAWMEVSADFGGGSSGSGVFNSTGEVIGVVSKIRALKRGDSERIVEGKKVVKPGYVEMHLHRCADLESIKACFKSSE